MKLANMMLKVTYIIKQNENVVIFDSLPAL